MKYKVKKKAVNTVLMRRDIENIKMQKSWNILDIAIPDIIYTRDDFASYGTNRNRALLKDDDGVYFITDASLLEKVKFEQAVYLRDDVYNKCFIVWKDEAIGSCLLEFTVDTEFAWSGGSIENGYKTNENYWYYYTDIEDITIIDETQMLCAGDKALVITDDYAITKKGCVITMTTVDLEDGMYEVEMNGEEYRIDELSHLVRLKQDYDVVDEAEEAVEEKEEKMIANDDIKQLTDQIKKLTKEIKQKDRIQDILNEAVIDKAKDIAVEDLKERLEDNLSTFIENKYGVLPKQIEIKTDTKTKTITGILHKEYDYIVKLIHNNIPLMLVGGAGSGKNHTLEQVAETLDLEFYFSNAVNQEYKLTGFIDANGVYHETQFYKAFTKGGLFMLDEIDASSPEALIVLNSAIANKYFDFPTGREKAHKDFRVVCAGNTYGTGADMVYVGRNVLDGATLDRFVVVNFDYDENVEMQLAYDKELFDFVIDLRQAIAETGIRYIVSMRATINATKQLECAIEKSVILKTSILKNMSKDDINTIVNKLKTRGEWYQLIKGLSSDV